MKHLVIFFSSVILLSQTAFSVEIPNRDQLDQTPPQPVFSQFQRNMPFQHDQGFYLGGSIGPAWVFGLNNPKSQAIRAAGDISIGWMPWNKIALHLDVWGTIFEESSLVAVGPGATFFLPEDWAISFALGLGQAFSFQDGKDNFSESVLAGRIKAAKYWWITPDLSIGPSVAVGFHGFSFRQGAISNVGGDITLGLDILFN